MFARLSTIDGKRGPADAERDIRGFAPKSYTEEGGWDVAGNNMPVFIFHECTSTRKGHRDRYEELTERGYVRHRGAVLRVIC